MWGPGYAFVGDPASNAAYYPLYTPGLNVTPAVIENRRLVDGLIIIDAFENVNPAMQIPLNAKLLNATGLTPSISNFFCTGFIQLNNSSA